MQTESGMFSLILHIAHMASITGITKRNLLLPDPQMNCDDFIRTMPYQNRSPSNG